MAYSLFGQEHRRTGRERKHAGKGRWMKTRNAGRERYAADKPEECKYCYFWNAKRQCCRQKECYYLLLGETLRADNMSKEIQQQDERVWDCWDCPYGRHSLCIGYCTQKIVMEMRQKKQAAGKGANHSAG